MRIQMTARVELPADQFGLGEFDVTVQRIRDHVTAQHAPDAKLSLTDRVLTVTWEESTWDD